MYIQLATQMIKHIRAGVLKPGTKLPSIRRLSVELNLNPNTVVNIYEELILQGWVYTKPKSGVFVSDQLPELKPRSFKPEVSAFNITHYKKTQESSKCKYYINDGFPDYRVAPINEILRQYKKAFYSQNIEKISLTTNAISSWGLRASLIKDLYTSRGIQATEAQIAITRGAQMGIYLATAALIKSGDYVLVGEPGFAIAHATFEKLGAKLIKIPVDEKGIDIGLVEKAIKRYSPRLLYLVPHHHHPTTVILTSERRMHLISLIQKYKIYVLEDDYDYEFHFDHTPILPLASADHRGCVIYIGSLTKILTSSLRIGFVIASEKIIKNIEDHKRLIDGRGDLMLQEAVADLYENGTIQRHIRKSLKLYRQRRDLLCNALTLELGDSVSFTRPQGGMSVWIKFNKKYPVQKIAYHAKTLGLHMSDGSFYKTSDQDHNAIRIGFASLNDKEITGIVSILKQAIKECR